MKSVTLARPWPIELAKRYQLVRIGWNEAPGFLKPRALFAARRLFALLPKAEWVWNEEQDDTNGDEHRQNHQLRPPRKPRLTHFATPLEEHDAPLHAIARRCLAWRRHGWNRRR